MGTKTGQKKARVVPKPISKKEKKRSSRSREAHSDDSIENARGPFQHDDTPAPPPDRDEAVDEAVGPAISVTELRDIVGVLSGAIKDAFDAKSEAFFKAKKNRTWDRQTLWAINEEVFPDFDFSSAPEDARAVLEAVCFTVVTAHRAQFESLPDRQKTLNTSEVALAEVLKLDNEGALVGDSLMIGDQSMADHSFFTQVKKKNKK